MAIVRSVLNASTAAARRVIVAAAAPTAAPALATDGYVADGSDWIHIYLAFVAPATACEIVPWFYSSIAELWYAGDTLSFSTTGDLFAVVETRGEERVYLQVVSIAGAGTVSAWAGYSYDGQRNGVL